MSGDATLSTAIVWFRQDLRLRDHPALDYARRHYQQVVAVYIHDPDGEAPWPPGAASRWWLHHSLAALADELKQLGNHLIVLHGDSGAILEQVIEASGANGVFWNRRYEPQAVQRDSALKQRLRQRPNLECRSFNGNLWWEPWVLKTTSGGPYRVFTPLWKRMLAEWQLPTRLARPRQLPLTGPSLERLSRRRCPTRCELADLALLPRLDWAADFNQLWQPGERGAARQFTRFIRGAVDNYAGQRDIPELDGTSRLSPYLHFGEISPVQVIDELSDAGLAPTQPGRLALIRELAWREFSQHLLYHFPETPERPLMGRFEAFPWRAGYRRDLRRWQQGKTGVPIVDAGMRQLWRHGWMHNRVRMIVASFLTKNLLIPWQEGARWFWDTLVDADLGSNTQGWQWTAGCGADAAPYFRIFNPVSQGQRFDPQGIYVKRWVPELRALPAAAIHQPWKLSDAEQAACRVRLGRDYPAPLVDLKVSRERALTAYRELPNNC